MVAWCAAMRVEYRQLPTFVVVGGAPFDIAIWRSGTSMYVDAGLSYQHVAAAADSFGPLRREEKRSSHWCPFWKPGGGFKCLGYEAHGWPFRSFYTGYFCSDRRSVVAGIIVDQTPRLFEAPLGLTTYSFRPGYVPSRALPLRPIPTGIVGNSVVYAVAVLTGATAWRRIRCVVRRISGKCTRCGYSLSGLPTRVCPECGHTRSK